MAEIGLADAHANDEAVVRQDRPPRVRADHRYFSAVEIDLDHLS